MGLGGYFAAAGDGSNVVWCCTTATTNNIHPTFPAPVFQYGGHTFWRVIILSKFVGQTRIRIATDRHPCNAGHFFNKRTHLRRTKGTIQPHTHQIAVGYGNPKCLCCLSAQRPTGIIGNRSAHHDRDIDAALFFTVLMANNAALQLSVSNTVSTNMRCTPASRRASVCSV